MCHMNLQKKKDKKQIVFQLLSRKYKCKEENDFLSFGIAEKLNGSDLPLGS